MFEHFITTNGGVVFPAYTSKEVRQALRDRLARENIQLYCSCSREDKLYYKISSDLRFIPCHQNYKHSENCVRFGGARKSILVHDEDTGVSTVYLRFNPANFSVPSVSTEEPCSDESSAEVSTEIAEGEEQNKNEEDDKPLKEPFSPLARFIRTVNYDSYMDRLISTGKVFSFEYFLSALYGRLQYVRISPMKKSIKELDYKKDGFKFFYAGLTGYQTEERSIITINYFGKSKNYFVYPAILQKVLRDFVKQYGVEPDFNNDKLMVAGFMHERISRKGSLYITPGRFHIFKVNNMGIYCDNSIALSVTNALYKYIQERRLYHKCKLYFDIDDYNKICDLRIMGRVDYLSFVYKVREPYDTEKVVPCGVLEEELLISVLDDFV